MKQTGRFCWSEMQDLLLRVASFAARPFAKILEQSTSTTRRIPKTFLLRDIPTLAFVFGDANKVRTLSAKRLARNSDYAEPIKKLTMKIRDAQRGSQAISNSKNRWLGVLIYLNLFNCFQNGSFRSKHRFHQPACSLRQTRSFIAKTALRKQDDSYSAQKTARRFQVLSSLGEQLAAFTTTIPRVTHFQGD